MILLHDILQIVNTSKTFFSPTQSKSDCCVHQISYHISYHIISHHIISYRIILYHIISYHIISYHNISYLNISYHIISYHIQIVPRDTSMQFRIFLSHNFINHCSIIQGVFFLLYRQTLIRRSLNFLLHFLNSIITSIVCLAPVVECLTSLTGGVRQNAGRASGGALGRRLSVK
jgi:hypothetical protein